MDKGLCVEMSPLLLCQRLNITLTVLTQFLQITKKGHSSIPPININLMMDGLRFYLLLYSIALKTLLISSIEL